MKLPNNERNTGNQRPVGNMAVSVSIPVHQRNTAGLFTSLLITTQGHLTYRQETQKHGKKYNGRPSVERSNKCEKEDYKLSRMAGTALQRCSTATSTAS